MEQLYELISLWIELLRETEIPKFIKDVLPLLEQIDATNGVNISADLEGGEVTLKFSSIPKDEDDSPDCDDCPYCCPNCGECLHENFNDGEDDESGQDL